MNNFIIYFFVENEPTTKIAYFNPFTGSKAETDRQ